MTVDASQFPRTVIWRRIDEPGMDSCRFGRSDDGYLVSGTALYLHKGAAARFEYRVSCHSDWSSRSAWVGGWLGARELEVSLSRDTTGAWTVDGVDMGDVHGRLDVDLGFTPATNTNAIRRMGLAVGQEVETTAVWLDVDAWRVKPLRQIYRRLSETEYAYLSPTNDYSAILSTDAFGVVRQYPDLWHVIPESHPPQS